MKKVVVSSKSGSLRSVGATFKVLDTQVQADEYIEQKTKQGYTCHVFDYGRSFKSDSNLISFSIKE